MRIARNNARNDHNALDTMNHAMTADGALQRKHGALSLEFGHVARYKGFDMSVYDVDMLGYCRHTKAIERIKMFCENKRVVCAFSGGKDSQVCYHLLDEAGIEFEASYSITRFEPVELIEFVKKTYPKTKFRRKYEMSLIDEIELRGLPNMFARWCCNAKHAAQDDCDVVVIGIRSSESAKRKANWKTSGYKRDGSFYICPIIDWTDSDVWEYLSDKPHCKIYDEGYTRIGCVCCPLVPSKMMSDATRWPKTAAVLRKGANKFVARMRARKWTTKSGKPCSSWHKADNPEAEYWRRWITTGMVTDGKTCEANCMFDGTGFSEYDGIEEEENT